MARIHWRSSPTYRGGFRPSRASAGRAWLGRLLLAGAVATLGEAAARFGWLTAPTGLPFPPEALAQQLFAVVPMDVFALAVRWLGSAAQWVAFVLMLVVWAAVAGGLAHAVAAVTNRSNVVWALLAGAGLGLLVQAALWLAAPVLAPGGWAAVSSAALWPGAALPAAGYGLAVLLSRRGESRRLRLKGASRAWQAR